MLRVHVPCSRRSLSASHFLKQPIERGHWARSARGSDRVRLSLTRYLSGHQLGGGRGAGGGER
jgi:hypothetical protein